MDFQQPVSLIELLSMQEIDLKKIQECLIFHSLPPHGDDRLPAQMARKNAYGQGVFELASAKNNLELLNLLLDFDMLVPDNYDQSGLSKEVIALLDSRGAWQREIQGGETGFLFNYTNFLVGLALKEIEVSIGEGLLVLGQTAHGKSTLCNYMAGVTYEKSGRKLLRREDSKVAEIVKVGSGKRSETFFPQANYFENLGVTWVDLAGLFDTRGPTLEICSAIATRVVTEKLKKIRAILLVCQTETENSGFTAYRNITKKLGRILGDDPELAKRILYVVTKPQEGMVAEDVISELKELWHEEDFSSLDNHIGKSNEHMQDKLAIKRVTEIILQRTPVIIADVTKPDARGQLQKAIEALPPSIDHSRFNFGAYHNMTERYKGIFNFIRIKHANLLLKQEKWQAEYTKHEQEYKEYEQEWRSLKEEQKKLAEEGIIQARMAENSAEQERVSGEIEMLNAKIKSLHEQKSRLVLLNSRFLKQREIIKAGGGDPPSLNGNTILQEYYDKMVTYNEQVLQHLLSQLKGKKSGLAASKIIQEELRQEKINIEVIRQTRGNSLNDKIAKTEKRMIEAEKCMKEAKEKLLSIELTLKVNQSFFKNIVDLTAHLGFLGKVTVQESAEKADEHDERSISARSKRS